MGADLLCRPDVPLTKEGPKRIPPLVPDTVLSEALKCHWTQKDYEGPYGVCGQMVFRLSAYVDLLLLDMIWGDEKSYLPFVSTKRPPIRTTD